MLRQMPLTALQLALIYLTVSMYARAFAQSLEYPKTRKLDHTDTYFGTVVADPYHWLEDANSPETKEWVEAENRVTFDYLGRIPFRSAVLNRLKTLADYPKYTAPRKKGDYVFFSKNSGLQNQSVLYIQKGYDGAPEVLLDPNTFSPDGTVRLAAFRLSKDGRYAAYGKTAIPGSDWVTLFVMDMNTRQTLPDELRWAKYGGGVSWRGNGFYYNRYPEPSLGTELTARNENQKVYYHKIGTPQSADVLVYEDTAHPTYSAGVVTTEDERFAILYMSDPNKRGNALSYREETGGPSGFTPIVGEITENSFGVLDNVGDMFMIGTNNRAPNQKVMLYDPKRPDEKNWKTILPEKSTPLAGLTTAGGKLFATYLKDVTTHTYVYDRDGKLENEIAFPAPGTAGGFDGEKGDTEVFYSFTSLNYPPTIFRYNIATRASTVFHAPEIPGFTAADYVSKQVFFKSKDGTRVPMFLVYKKGLRRSGKNPTILYGYGGFNITINPTFSAIDIAWLEQGGVLAQANLRGGGEYGEKWHEAGMRLHKQNVFDDCIAAAEYLIREKYTSPARLALQGGSNGGLLVGAVINQRPDLFKVALPSVGVMDMLRFQKFTAGVGWVSDYGSSDDETQFKYLLGYSPLHNIKSGAKYPATLVTTSDHDDRVVPAHSFKYVSTLQEKNPGGAPLLIRIETNSGHGASNLTKALEETADEFAFTWANMGITPKYPH